MRIHVKDMLILSSLCFCASVVHPQHALAGTTYLGAAIIHSDATDLSGLTDLLEDGSPHNMLGGIGSGIAYMGAPRGGNRYILLPDRGPNANRWNTKVDHTTSYQVRFHTFEITVEPRAPDDYHVAAKLLDTTLLTDENARPFVGISTAFDSADVHSSLRRDPEGVRVGATGSVFISDEYGPFIDEFGADGRRVRSVPIPEKFLVKSPATTRKGEQPPRNHAGRLPNRGMEGLAISPDGRTLWGIMQSPLIQDNGEQTKASTPFVRILQIDLTTHATREFLYLLDDCNDSVSEIVAVNDYEFLVIERDGHGGRNAKSKKIMHVDVRNASDVSGIEDLSDPCSLRGVVAVSKTTFLDLVAGRCTALRSGLGGARGIKRSERIVNFDRFRNSLTRNQLLDLYPEKIEGIAFGPDLPDGRRLLLIVTDNDFLADQPSYIIAFAIDRRDLPGFRHQHCSTEHGRAAAPDARQSAVAQRIDE